MSVNQPTEALKINNTEIDKNLVDEKTKKDYESFAEKSKKKPEEAGEIF